MMIVHILDQTRLAYGTPDLAGDFSQRDIADAEAKLGSLAAEVRAAKLTVETSLVIGRAPDEILKVAEKTDAGQAYVLNQLH